jgi:uncharacterized phage-like protein YoqJ
MDSINYTNRVCSFTGYRPQKLNACLARSPSSLTLEDIESVLRRQMLEMLDAGFTTFQSGMAIGGDLMFARIATELREQYSSHLVKLIAVIPCLEHDKAWGESDRILCRELTAKADKVVLVSDRPYFDGCMAKRNRRLVDTCDEMLAVYDGQRGGTMQTINYAKGKGLKVTIIDPSKEKIIILRESLVSEKKFN